MATLDDIEAASIDNLETYDALVDRFGRDAVEDLDPSIQRCGACRRPLIISAYGSSFAAANGQLITFGCDGHD